MGRLGGLIKAAQNSRLIGNASVYVLGNMLQKALSFLLIPVYTRYLTPSDYGITGLATATGSVLAIVLGLGISGSVARHYYDYNNSPNRLRQYITANFSFLAASAGILTLLLSWRGPFLWPRITSGQIPFSPYILIVLWTSYADVLTQTSLSLYRTRQRASAFMTAQLGSFALTLGATILLVVVLHMGARGQLLGSLIGAGATAVVLSVLLVRRWFCWSWNWQDVWIGLAFGLPLVPHGLASWALVAIDRFLLETRIPLAELGLYNLGYQIGLAMAVLVTSINLAWSPYYYNLMKTHPHPEKRVRQVAEIYMAALGGVCMLGILFSREILLVIAPPQYQLASRYVPLILLSYLLNGYYYFVSMPLFYYKKTHLIPLLTMAAALINIALNLWWIPRSGAFGSAWATLVAYAAWLAIAYFLGRRYQRVNYSLRQFAVLNLLILAGALLVTYAASVGHLSDLVWKLPLLALFAALAYGWLVKPNLELFGPRARNGGEIEPGTIS